MSDITLSTKEYKRLAERSEWLSCLEEAGVDNWEGCEIAIQIKHKRAGEEIDEF